MKYEPAVMVDQQQMDVFEQMAKKTGINSQEFVRRVLAGVMAALEDAGKAHDPVHGSFAQNLPVVCASGNVVPITRKP